jgi:hypothetical protein
VWCYNDGMQFYMLTPFKDRRELRELAAGILAPDDATARAEARKLWETMSEAVDFANLDDDSGAVIWTSAEG